MKEKESQPLTVSVNVDLPVEKAWELFTVPHHIVHWYNASPDWHTSYAENDLRPGGRFMFRMESRDGNHGFDFSGEYSKVVKNEVIDYEMADGRAVSIIFEQRASGTHVTESFDAEDIHTKERQQEGWQAILNNFGTYALKSKDIDHLHFEEYVDAPAEKAFGTMTGRDTYIAWTRVFNSSSRFEGSWEKGSKISFMGAEADGSLSGMTGFMKENRPGSYLSIEYAGIIKKGAEVTDGPEAEKWKGFLENYTFSLYGMGTLVSVDTDSRPEYSDYFRKTWPEALKVLKLLCEGK